MALYIAYFFISIATIVLLITSYGIFKTKDTLQKLHFTTIIDILCFPMVFVAIFFTFGPYHTRLIYAIIIMVILSPISAYFIGKLYYTLYKHQVKPESQQTKS